MSDQSWEGHEPGDEAAWRRDDAAWTQRDGGYEYQSGYGNGEDHGAARTPDDEGADPDPEGAYRHPDGDLDEGRDSFIDAFFTDEPGTREPGPGEPGADAPGGEATGRAGGGGGYVPRHLKGAAASPEPGEGGKRHRSTARRVLIGLNIAVALTLVVSGLAVGYAAWRLNQINRVHITAEVPVGKDRQSQVPVVVQGHKVIKTSAAPPETFLIVGSDSRAALDQPGDAQKYGSGAEVGGARSDTIMLARVVPATKQVALLSIPRDTYLDIPGLGMQKINAALGVSPNLLVQVIEKNFHLDINHYVDVDFDSFKDIADALGGVEVYFPTEVRDVNAGLYIGQPGCVNLTGSLALAFVRSREYTYYVPGKGWTQELQSDLARIQRQQIFIRKLAAKAKTEGLGNPITLDGIIGGLTKNLTVDDSLSNQDLVHLAATFRSIDPANIVGWTMPTTAETLHTSSGPDDVLLPESSADQAMEAQFLDFGEPAGTTVTDTNGRDVLGSTTTSTTVPGETGTGAGGTQTAGGKSGQKGHGSSTTSSTVAPSSIEVTVVNASGVAGQAGKTTAGLRQLGFDVVATDNGTPGHTTTVVEYGAGGHAAAEAVAAHLSGPVTVQEVSGLGSSSVQVLTGTRLTGVATVAKTAPAPSAPTTATTSTTEPSTTTSTVPPTTSTTYVLPGTPSTGAPSCPS